MVDFVDLDHRCGFLTPAYRASMLGVGLQQDVEVGALAVSDGRSLCPGAGTSRYRYRLGMLSLHRLEGAGGLTPVRRLQADKGAVFQSPFLGGIRVHGGIIGV